MADARNCEGRVTTSSTILKRSKMLCWEESQTSVVVIFM